MITVNLEYFKPSGKYYSSGTYESSKEHMFEIFDEVREMCRNQALPGLVIGHSDYAVYVSSNHEYSYPCLIPIKKQCN
jgi:hypothetical protein